MDGCGCERVYVLQVRGVFKEMLRRHHVLFSIFLAHEDAQVVLTLAQRVTVRSNKNGVGDRRGRREGSRLLLCMAQWAVP